MHEGGTWHNICVKHIKRTASRVFNTYFGSVTLSIRKMPPKLTDVPLEIHIMIFEHLNDLDDASHLGNSCQLFRRRLATHLRTIERAIIVSKESRI